MTDQSLTAVEAELERERRSLAMLPSSSPITRERAIALIERCQQAIRVARRVM